MGKYPTAYYQILTPSIPKKEKGNGPLDHRLLAIFTALYRIEAGAWFDQLLPWLQSVLHKDVIGAIPGREGAEVAWDAQAYLEYAMMMNQSGAISTYDFKKYFDSFDYQFTKKMLVHLGFPANLAEATCHLYSNAAKTLKKGKSLSETFSGYNGIGQGDILSLIPAMALVSWQFKVMDAMYPRVGKGAYFDDKLQRNSRRFDCIGQHPT